MFGHDSNTKDDNQSSNTPPDITEPANTTAPTMPADSLEPPSNSGAPAVSPPADNTDNQDTGATLPPPSAGNTDDLLHIKQQALQQLSPLVNHLDQTPEEKFRTTMMMIQASDDQTLIQSAYDAAKDIQDEKARAQALLDIVNEINYFTQQANNN